MMFNNIVNSQFKKHSRLLFISIVYELDNAAIANEPGEFTKLSLKPFTKDKLKIYTYRVWLIESK